MNRHPLLKTIILTAGLMCCGAAMAASRDDVIEAMGKCAAVADDKARLACYDALAPRVRDAMATPPTSLDHEPTKQEQESWFGFDIGSLFGGGSTAPTTPEQFGKERTQEADQARQHEEIDGISAGVTEVAFTPFGQFILFLDNGQVWRQIPGDADRAHFKSKAADNEVTITRGLLGSYNITINDSAKLYKVTRVK
ncbi:MAG TPA: hypothetical protein VGM17_08705 [Rhizomicrobium sp.]|jgi:hypothetical protein